MVFLKLHNRLLIYNKKSVSQKEKSNLSKYEQTYSVLVRSLVKMNFIFQ